MIESLLILFTLAFFAMLAILTFSKTAAHINIFKVLMTITTSAALLALYFLFFYFQGFASKMGLPEEFQIKFIEVNKNGKIYILADDIGLEQPFLYETPYSEEAGEDAQEIAEMLKQGKIVKVKKGQKNKGKDGYGDKEGQNSSGSFSISEEDQYYILPDPTLNRKDEK